jgi:DNA polymerase-3 subunit epsilon
VLFAVPQRTVLMQVSFLLPCRSNPAVAINGIEAATTCLPQPWRAGLACFSAMVDACEAVVAHNAAFDRQWFGHGELPALERPWICSMEDIRWPPDRQLRATPSVRDLALAHAVPVWAAHRALTDCIHRAREAGFRWNDPVPKAWTRRLSEREVAALPFPVEAVAA